MKEFLPVIRSSSLFSGISETELTAMLSCLETREERFPKDTFLLRTGDTAESIGLVLSGSVLVVQEDIWGNRNILSKAGPGQTFAAAYACAPGSLLNVSVLAETPVTAMFLNVKRVLNVCPSACEHHSRIIRNLLGELAEKNLRFNEKLTHMGQRTTRSKIMSYLSAEAQRLGKSEFENHDFISGYCPSLQDFKKAGYRGWQTSNQYRAVDLYFTNCFHCLIRHWGSSELLYVRPLHCNRRNVHYLRYGTCWNYPISKPQ